MAARSSVNQIGDGNVSSADEPIAEQWNPSHQIELKEQILSVRWECSEVEAHGALPLWVLSISSVDRSLVEL
jgi:hypothetical protein